MICEGGGEGSPGKIGGGGEEIAAKVSAEPDGDGVEQASEHEEPGGLKVEITTPAVLIRQHVAIAGGHGGAGGGDRDFEERMAERVASFAPIEARV